jgi:hypothetical protein
VAVTTPVAPSMLEIPQQGVAARATAGKLARTTARRTRRMPKMAGLFI